MFRRHAVTLATVLSLAAVPAALPSLAAAASTDTTVAKEPRSTSMSQSPVAGRTASYVVNLRSTSRADRLAAHKAVNAAGGRVVVQWADIGVLVVQSTKTQFLTRIRKSAVVTSAGATRSVPVRRTVKNASMNRAEGQRVSSEKTQWNMSMIKAAKAKGSRNVTVGVVDSGIDPTHPDLRAAVNPRKSVGCTDGGRPDTSMQAWRATNDTHGTHVAGIIGAARNRTGIVGVAPGVRLASIKVLDAQGMIYPEYAICGVMEAAKMGVEVANHSYFVDPFAFWCDDQIGQAAVKESLRRAFAYSTRKGVVNVAAAGNAGIDFTEKSYDSDSPTDASLRMRRINSGCHDLPTELPGVVTVSAIDASRDIAPYSNDGLGFIDVAAPGDEVLSTVAGGRYARESGTSMAAPHVAGVLALLAARHPHDTPARLTARLEQQATALPCPKGDDSCVTKKGVNSYFGHGLVNAAVR